MTSRLARAFPAIAVALLLTAAYWTTLGWLVGRWRTDPFYSHGPLVPLVAAGVLWARRDRLRLQPAATLPAVAVLAAAAVLHLLGVRLMFEFLSCLSILAMLSAVALLAGGRPLLRAASFPLLYLLFAIPLPMILLQQVSLPLQLFSTVCAKGVLSALGCDVARAGVLLVFPKFTLAVADACSGLRSLLTVLAIATLAAHLSTGSLARKTALVALSSVAALLVNVLRITLAALIGIAFDGETACLIFEKYSGYFFFALVVLSTVGVFKLLSAEASPEPGPAAAEPVSPWALLRFVVVPILAVAIPMSGAAMLLKAGRNLPPPALLAGWRPEIPGWEAAEVETRPAYPGEEQLTGIFRDRKGLAIRFNLLHSVSGRYLHSPEACSMAAGWIPERQIARSGLNLWILRRGSDRACVVFWFDLGGKLRQGSFDQHLGALGQRLRRGVIDSAYGEIVIPLPAGSSADEGSLLELSRSLHEAVGRRIWPAR